MFLVAPRLQDTAEDRRARFKTLYQACRKAGQSHDDIASVCRITPPKLSFIIEDNDDVAQELLDRLEKWTKITNVEAPAVGKTASSFHDGSQRSFGEPRMAATVTSAGPETGTRLNDQKVSKKQHDEFRTIVKDLRNKYNLTVAQCLRATGYASLTGLEYAIENGPKVWVYERTKYICNAMLSGNFTLEQAFEQADRRWPVPDRKRGRRRKTSSAQPVAVQGDRSAQGPAEHGGRPVSARELPELAAGLKERLVQGFAVIEQCGSELLQITNRLLEIAKNPEMPVTVRMVAGNMVRGLNEHVLFSLTVGENSPAN